jgi:hypothetical protein
MSLYFLCMLGGRVWIQMKSNLFWFIEGQKLAPLGMPKWVWAFMSRYRMVFVRTSTLPLSMHRKLTGHDKTTNSGLNSHVELEDNSIILFLEATFPSQVAMNCKWTSIRRALTRFLPWDSCLWWPNVSLRSEEFHSLEFPFMVVVQVFGSSLFSLYACGWILTLVGHYTAFPIWADTIFGSAAKNINIYEEHAKDVVLSAVAGFNGTWFLQVFNVLSSACANE